MKEKKNELEFIKDCIKTLKRIKKWTREEKKMYYELVERKQRLEVEIKGLK